MNKKQKTCKHENIEGTETYGVYGNYSAEDKKIYLKQGDGGLNCDLVCLDCGKDMNDIDSEFI